MKEVANIITWLVIYGLGLFVGQILSPAGITFHYVLLLDIVLISIVWNYWNKDEGCVGRRWTRSRV